MRMKTKVEEWRGRTKSGRKYVDTGAGVGGEGGG